MATSIIQCHPFSGTNENEPPCYLLQLDNFHCLLDCGWDSKFSDNYVLQVAKYAKLIDAVFISHSDVRHMGALPYLVGKCGLNCPVYMTGPVSAMGHLFLYDAFLSICETQNFTRFNLDDIDASFDLVVPLKYKQTKDLHGKGQGVTVTPYVAGHMIGGAIWKIGKDGLDIVYAMDYNHRKENHLNGAVLDSPQILHLLITSSYHSTDKLKKEEKEKQLKETLQNTLKENGNILFLSDTAGRSLELVYLLEKLWRRQESGLMAYGLAFLNNMAFNVIDFAKSNVEWLADEMTAGFENTGWKPFHLKYTTLCHGMNDIKYVPEPMIAVVSQSHLNYGFGRELLAKWCENERNLVVVTTRNRELCLGTDLYNHAKNSNGKSELFVATVKEEPRADNEDFLMKLTQDSLFQVDKTQINESINETAMEMGDDDLDSDEEDAIKMEWDSPTNGTLVLNKDPYSLHQDENGMSSDGTGFRLPGFDIYPGQHSHRATKRLSLVFPSTERKVNWDIYGEHIDVKDPNYLNTAGSSYAMDIINQKLMWDGINKMGPLDASRKMYDSTNDDMAIVRNQIMDSFDSARRQQHMVNTTTTSPINDLTIKCPVIYQDYEGLADDKAIKQMISLWNPQEIIIVGGSRTDSELLASYCKNGLGMSDSLVHVAESGQVVNCTKEGHIYQARMSDALVSSLSFQKVGKYELAWLDAVIKMPLGVASGGGSGSVIGNELVVASEADALVEVNQIPVLELPDGVIPEHSTIFINEPKLSDLKTLLIKKGRNAEFNAGVLVVDNCVAIKRIENGKLILEGSFSETYFEVREVLYSQFAIL